MQNIDWGVLGRVEYDFLFDKESITDAGSGSLMAIVDTLAGSKSHDCCIKESEDGRWLVIQISFRPWEKDDSLVSSCFAAMPQDAELIAIGFELDFDVAVPSVMYEQLKQQRSNYPFLSKKKGEKTFSSHANDEEDKALIPFLADCSTVLAV